MGFAEGVVVGGHIPLAEIVHYQWQVGEGVVSADIGRSPVAVEREVVESVVFRRQAGARCGGQWRRADVALGVGARGCRSGAPGHCPAGRPQCVERLTAVSPLDKVQGGELCIVEDDVGGIGFGLA